MPQDRQRLVNVGLRLNFENSTLNQLSIRYLGHIIFKDGLRPNPDISRPFQML